MQAAMKSNLWSLFRFMTKLTAFETVDKEAKAEMAPDAVMDYLRIDVLCPRRGLWRRERRIA